MKQVSILDINEAALEDEDIVVSNIPEEVLLHMISNLPEERRLVFNMYCIDGYSHKEIAQQLGITEKGSAAILSKARACLRKEVADYVNEH